MSELSCPGLEPGGGKQFEMCEVELPVPCSLRHYETVTSIMGLSMELLAPLKRSANCWVRISICYIHLGINTNLLKMVSHKVKGFFNKFHYGAFQQPERLALLMPWPSNAVCMLADSPLSTLGANTPTYPLCPSMPDTSWNLALATACASNATIDLLSTCQKKRMKEKRRQWTSAIGPQGVGTGHTMGRHDNAVHIGIHHGVGILNRQDTFEHNGAIPVLT